jgi:hypothetical protein
MTYDWLERRCLNPNGNKVRLEKRTCQNMPTSLRSSLDPRDENPKEGNGERRERGARKEGNKK